MDKKKTNRGSTVLFTFVVIVNWIFVAIMGIFGLRLLSTWFFMLGLLLLLFALLKGILTIGLMRFDNQSRVADALLSLMVYFFVGILQFGFSTTYYFFLVMLWFSFLFIQFCVLMFHPATVRLFHHVQDQSEPVSKKDTIKTNDIAINTIMKIAAGIIIVLTLLFTTSLTDYLLPIFIAIAIGVIIILFKRKKIDSFAETSDLHA